jgi:hypothetical protein
VQGDAVPTLHLAPAALGRTLALQQQLTITHGTDVHRLEALLEADAGELRLAVQAIGKPALRLRWDGARLEQTHADWLPPQLTGERVLTDLQLAYWPPAAISAALPVGWTLVASSAHRELREDDAVVVAIDYPAPDRIVIDEPLAGFRLDIASVPLDAGSP